MLTSSTKVWEGAFGENFEKVVGEGCVIDAATHDAKTREEWWYPDYVEEQCPGLPDWKALEKCAAIFATAETKPKRPAGFLPAWFCKQTIWLDQLCRYFDRNYFIKMQINGLSISNAFKYRKTEAKRLLHPIVHFNGHQKFAPDGQVCRYNVEIARLGGSLTRESRQMPKMKQTLRHSPRG